MVIKPKFEGAGQFSGFSTFVKYRGRSGYVDKSGRLVSYLDSKSSFFPSKLAADVDLLIPPPE